MPSNKYVSKVLDAALKLQIENHQKLNKQLKNINLDSISMAECVQHSKQIAKLGAKIEVYNEIIDLLKAHQPMGVQQ